MGASRGRCAGPRLRAAAVCGAALACALASPACSRDPDYEDRPIYLHSPKSCPLLEESAFSYVYGGGDFDPPAGTTPVAQVFWKDTGALLLGLPAKTRSVVVDVSQRGQSQTWRGFANVPASGPIDVLAWGTTEACWLSQNVGLRKGSTLGVFGRQLMVVGGVSPDGTQSPTTYVGDLRTAVVLGLALGMAARRSEPTVTAFGADVGAEGGDELVPALVAGGEDPESGRAIATAEVYLPDPKARGAIGDFDRAAIALSKPRTRHGAVVLESGETLLVGGRNETGVMRSTELVDPKKRFARTEGLADLDFARERPTVLRLASGEVLIAGGTDAQGKPVPFLEWLAPDGKKGVKRAQPLVAGRARAFTALEGGGALAVIVPEQPDPSFPTVWVISAAGVPEQALPIDSSELGAVRLFPGAEGSPLLWTGSRWMRWRPWFSAFETIPDAPASGPTNEDPTYDGIASGDSGLALWLANRGGSGLFVTGFRFATRTPFDLVPTQPPLLVQGPTGLAPDRVALGEGSAVVWGERGLDLRAGASAFVTDLTFADLDAELEVTGAAPIVVLRPEGGRELEVGGAACAGAQIARRKLVVRRRGKTVRYEADDGEARTCTAELASASVRVTLGLRGAPVDETSAARNLRISRR
jgi:hypothetical protein